MKLLSLFTMAVGLHTVLAELDASSPLQHRAAHKNRKARTLKPVESPLGSGTARRAVCAQRSKGGDASAAKTSGSSSSTQSTGCFPSAGFQMPDESSVSGNPPAGYWCDPSTENGFLGFSYGVDQCQSLSQLRSDFKQMKQVTNARYVRLYSSCDTDATRVMHDVITAAYENGLGVYALIWFGFNGDTSYKGREANMFAGLNQNKLTPYVLRHIDVGSEPLFDSAVDPGTLAGLINSVRNQASKWGDVTVSFSDMPYAWSTINGGQQNQLMQALDVVHANVLPYFGTSASTGNDAWSFVSDSISQLQGYMKAAGVSKKIIFTQTGWPTNNALWKTNSPNAQASTSSSSGYLNLLNSNCAKLKSMAGNGGVGWFWQIFNDSQLDGWGFFGDNGKAKYSFQAIMNC